MSSSLTFFLLFIIYTILTPLSSSARILLDVADPPQAIHHPTQPSITFIMQDIQPSTKNTQQQPPPPPLPFSKPLGTFPLTYEAKPLPYQTNPNDQNAPTQTALDMPRFRIVFPAPSTIQEELEFRSVTKIEENVYVESMVLGPTVVGMAKGVYVAINLSDNNGSNHMIAMTVSFSSIENGDDDNKSSEIDSLKFFGVHLRDDSECHVAVIGGSGKFKDANGYAVIKVVNNRYIGSTDFIEGSSEDVKLMLMYKVFLS